MEKSLPQVITRYLGFQKTCPSCNNTFVKPIKHRHMLFCPHCEQRYFLQDAIAEDSETNTRFYKTQLYAVTFSLLLTSASAVFIELKHLNYEFNWFYYVLYGALFLLFGSKYLSLTASDKVLHASKDNFSDIQQDDCEYLQQTRNETFCCAHCGSHRLVSMFNYRVARKRKDPGAFNHYASVNDRYTGCLSCLKVFQIEEITPEEKSEPTSKYSHINVITSFMIVVFCVYIMFFMPESVLQ